MNLLIGKYCWKVQVEAYFINNFYLILYNNFFPENVVDELENNLGRVTTITGSLKISRSFPIVSLDFFKKLVEIQGVRPAESEAKWDELKDSHYSLEILENENLQKLFPDGSNVTITQRLVITYIYTPTHKNQEVNAADMKVPCENFQIISIRKPL